ncbi:MAG: PQQ-dependent sugar dehydrogenase [Phycisphaerae bacterium]
MIRPLLLTILVFVTPAVTNAQINADENYLPDAYIEQTLAEGLKEPIALCVTDNDRVFVATRQGELHEVGPALDPDRPMLTLDVFADSECGLLGLAADPAFSQNGRLFLFATTSPTEQTIYETRITNNVAGEPLVVRGSIPSNGDVHNGGCLRVGPDSKLYFSVGDTGETEEAQNINSLAGKIGRINFDGSVPEDNPFTSPTGARRSTFASGFRNPFRFWIQSDGNLLVGDIGSDSPHRREEINLVTSGGNYGWPEVEGTKPDDMVDGDEFTDPIWLYVEEGQSIAGIVRYESDQYPSNVHDDLFVVDFVTNTIFHLAMEDGAPIAQDAFHATGAGPVELILDNQGRLLFTEFYDGTVKRIALASEPQDVDPVESAPDAQDMAITNGDSGVICGNGAIAPMIFLSGLLFGLRFTSRAGLTSATL